jgi:[acyl-carrier-protein] S-malonyltransferase
MVAIVGRTAVQEGARLIAEEDGDLVLANDNSPEQVMLSGSEEAVQRATESAMGAGLRAVPMPMLIAGHSPHVGAMIDGYRAALEQVEFRTPAVDVYSSATGRPFTNPVQELANAVAQPVRWREVLLELHARGARRFIDTGPGHVVASLAAKTLDGVETPTVTDLEQALA